MVDRTFAIIKPDSVKNGYTGKIYNRILAAWATEEKVDRGPATARPARRRRSPKTLPLVRSQPFLPHGRGRCYHVM